MTRCYIFDGHGQYESLLSWTYDPSVLLALARIISRPESRLTTQKLIKACFVAPYASSIPVEVKN